MSKDNGAGVSVCGPDKFVLRGVVENEIRGASDNVNE